MRYSGIDDFLAKDGLTRAKGVIKGPIAVIMAEDTVELDTTLRHHLAMGFGQMVLLAPDGLLLRSDLEDKVHRLDFDLSADDPIIATINRLIEAAPGVWFYYCFNAEYLFFPFCETRSINDLLAFHAEERRDAMLSYVIDLYAADLSTHPGAVSLDTALLDRSGYYALARPDPANGHPRERQLDFFGGLRWRFEEHVPENKRKIDRISIFRAKPGLRLRPDFTFNDQEYNTYACPWHNNLTAAVCSFRTAKALKANPGSKYGIDTFRWHNSTEFHWTSQQLLDLGLMEPGQWF